MEKILLAGSTGYLGGYILKELLKNKYAVRTVVRNENKLPASIQENGDKLTKLKIPLMNFATAPTRTEISSS